MKMTKAEKKIGKVMSEYGKGKLHSGSKKGPVVKSPKQAIAIALSEAGKSKPMMPIFTPPISLMTYGGVSAKILLLRVSKTFANSPSCRAVSPFRTVS